MATVTFIKYQKQSAGALCGVAGYVPPKAENGAGGRLAAGQRAELHTATGRPGVPCHPADAPEEQSGLVLSLCPVLLAG